MKRGDVVILDHPYIDGTGSKVRPALVVQNDRDNHRMTNTIVALITRNTSRVGEPTQVLIDVTTADGRQTGLNQTSAVVCTNLYRRAVEGPEGHRDLAGFAHGAGRQRPQGRPRVAMRRLPVRSSP